MPRYFMHIMDGVDKLIDDEGMLLPENGIIGAALRGARDCMAGDIQTGRLHLKHRIDVHNEAGELVHSIVFKDAVEFD